LNLETFTSGAHFAGQTVVDYSAAFDTVDHDILLQLLERSLGISGKVLKWIASFLGGRVHVILIGDRTSYSIIITCGVPQGSVLGPLLFILYTTDIIRIIEKHGFKVHLYSYDTQIYIHILPKDAPSLPSTMEKFVADVHLLSQARRLKLNPSKTELIWFDPDAQSGQTK